MANTKDESDGNESELIEEAVPGSDDKVDEPDEDITTETRGGVEVKVIGAVEGEPVLDFLLALRQFKNETLKGELDYFERLLPEASKRKRVNMSHKRDYCRTPDGKIYIYDKDYDEYWLMNADGTANEDESTKEKKLPEGTAYAEQDVTADWAWKKEGENGSRRQHILNIINDLENLQGCLIVALAAPWKLSQKIYKIHVKELPERPAAKDNKMKLKDLLEFMAEKCKLAKRYLSELIGFKHGVSTGNYFGCLLMGLETQLMELISGTEKIGDEETVDMDAGAED
jgi:hypothetical protein